MNISGITDIAATFIYGVLVVVALWGAFCASMVWLRVKQKRFRNEEEQNAFLVKLDERLGKGDFEGASEMCDGDARATCQLAMLALSNRQIGYSQVKQLVLDRFQREVLSDLEYRLSWVYTVIKAAPMVGLLGTVVGMMGAFATLASAESVNPEMLAGDISVALITTACGLAIAIPLVFCTAVINIRIRKMEDLVSAGMTQFFESFRGALGKTSQ